MKIFTIFRSSAALKRDLKTSPSQYRRTAAHCAWVVSYLCIMLLMLSLPVSAKNINTAVSYSAQTQTWASPKFSSPATDAELFTARVFDEPLIPMSGFKADPDENAHLAEALTGYLSRGVVEELSPIESFLEKYPQSRWRASLQTNLGLIYRRTGYLNRALNAFENAWSLARNETAEYPSAVADRAVSELADLNSRLGRFDRLGTLFIEIGTRGVRGSANEKLFMAHEGLGTMYANPGIAFLCGPLAVNNVRNAIFPKAEQDQSIMNASSTQQGTSLRQLADLAQGSGLAYQMAWRSPGAQLIMPSVLHWKAGHFAALMQETTTGKGIPTHYQLKDPTFGDEMWATAAALDEEASGYFLVPAGKLPDGWRAVDAKEGDKVWGKGYTTTGDPDDSGPGDETNRGCGSQGSHGMARYGFLSMLAGLTLEDTPVGYAPASGPAAYFTVRYNQRDSLQEAMPRHANFGPLWTYNWLSYIKAYGGAPQFVGLHRGGGGREKYVMTYNDFSANSGTSAPQLRTRSVLVKHSPTQFELQLPDGSREFYEQVGGSMATPIIYLSRVVDPFGNTLSLEYDANTTRLLRVRDAYNRITEIGYRSNALADPDYYRISTVTDPFTRSASFTYDSSRRLQKITDVVGIESSFTYGERSMPADFVTTLTTPYGSTSFNTGAVTDPTLFMGWTTNRWVEATDAAGTERIEFLNALCTGCPGLTLRDAGVGPETEVPTGITAINFHLGDHNSYYWDKKAFSEAHRDYTNPGYIGNPPLPSPTVINRPDYDKAYTIHWMGHYDDPHLISGIKASEKRAGQSRIWYEYQGQTNMGLVGDPTASSGFPIKIAQVLDPTTTTDIVSTTGVTQLKQFTYNAKGHMTRMVDPTGRRTDIVYAPNNIDVTEVRQWTGSGLGDLLLRQTYTREHLPDTITDAAGQTTSLIYNARGQTTSVTNPRHEATTFDYYTIGENNGYLHTSTDPAARVTRFDYSNHLRRVQVTNPENETITTDLDELNRPTLITYPDTTTEQFQYFQLNPSTLMPRVDAMGRNVKGLEATVSIDREGHTQRKAYDALRHLVRSSDGAGHVTRYDWCGCGGASDGGYGGGMTQMIDAENQVTHWDYDLLGHVTSKTLGFGTANASRTEYDYDQTGRVKQRRDAQGYRSNYTYTRDDAIHHVSYADPSGRLPAVPSAIEYQYDTYYPRKHLVQRIGGMEPSVFTYYPAGVLGAGKIQTLDGPLADDTITYGYDELGRKHTRSLSGVTTTWNYDSLGRITNEANGLGLFTYLYEQPLSNRVTTMLYPNGQHTAYGYFGPEHDHRASSLTNYGNGAGSVLSSLQYTNYNHVGQILAMQNTRSSADTARTFGISYDAAAQLEHFNITPTPMYGPTEMRTHQYDTAGNRRQATSSAWPSVMTYDYDHAANRMTDWVWAGATTTLSYNANGDLTRSDDTGTTYEWDAENRLTAVQRDPQRSEFSYDPMGRRSRNIERAGTAVQRDVRYVWDGNELIEERDSATNRVTKRFYPLGVQITDAAGTARNYYYTRDHLGSVLEMVDSTGNNVIAQYQYDEWGTRQRIGGSDWTINAPVGYAGYFYHSESQLNLTRHRAYSPFLGRWLSRDPIEEAGGMNLYAYVNNDPMNKTDPSGLTPAAVIVLGGSINPVVAVVVVVVVVVVVAAAAYHDYGPSSSSDDTSPPTTNPPPPTPTAPPHPGDAPTGPPPSWMPPCGPNSPPTPVPDRPGAVPGNPGELPRQPGPPGPDGHPTVPMPGPTAPPTIPRPPRLPQI